MINDWFADVLRVASIVIITFAILQVYVRFNFVHYCNAFL